MSKTQTQNTRGWRHMQEAQGQKLQWCREHGVSAEMVSHTIRHGWCYTSVTSASCSSSARLNYRPRNSLFGVTLTSVGSWQYSCTKSEHGRKAAAIGECAHGLPRDPRGRLLPLDPLPSCLGTSFHSRLWSSSLLGTFPQLHKPVPYEMKH